MESKILTISTNEYFPQHRESKNEISCSGFCRKCGKEHRLGNHLAEHYSRKLMQMLASKKRIDLTVPDTEADPRYGTDYLYGKARGQMFGVMVYQSQDGTKGVIPSFSCQYNGVWQIDGWAPPLFNVNDFSSITCNVEREIKVLSHKIDLLDSNSIIRKDYISTRKSLSQRLMKDIHGLYRLTNFCGETKSIFQVFAKPKGIPTGTGDCCAPKLLNYAAVNKLTPLGISEFFWGKENRSQSKQQGKFYNSCPDKCQPILGYMLCGLTEPYKT